MKRILSVLVLLLALSLVTSALADDPLRVVALKGPTAMGMAKMMSDDNGEAYAFTVESAADLVAPLVIQGKVDIAAVPANLAAVLYNKTEGQVQVIAVNTLGVLYIVERGETVKTVEDLRGRTIYASGQGATPEYALNYILRGNGIDPEQDVNIEWKTEHAECLTALLQDETGIALLPQPFVTTAMMKAEGLRVALDLNDLWNDLQAESENPSSLLTGVVIVRKAYAEENPEKVNAFLENYAGSVEWTNANTDDAAAVIASFEIVPEAVAKKALPACNIVCIRAGEMQTMLSGYLSVLFEANPASVGGKLPGEDFYYLP
ncbi:MAG: ABC transporter substrate-binding protein [Clostridia bacterium]|nr:ABC transporter substrate-binding protein [Clostridia bacterium]